MHRKRGEKYTRIIEAGVTIFTRKGYHESKMDEVAREARVGKGTLYNYFANKESLFAAILEEGIDNLAHFVEEKRDPKSCPSMQLKQALEALLLYFSQNREFCIFLVRESYGGRKEVQPQFYKLHEIQNTIFRPIIEQGKQRGEFEVEDADAMTAAIVGAVFSSSIHYFLSTDQFPVTRIADTIDSLLHRGLIRKRLACEEEGDKEYG